MNIQTWLRQTQQFLEKAGISTARLDALVLLEDALNKNRTHLLAHPEFVMTDEQVSVLSTQIKRRAQHEPLAYIRGKTEFYGRDFIITSAVLEPRPESETIIELLKTLPLSNNQRIADIGTGSGALGITAALELPTNTVDLIEIDDAAIEVAKMNVVLHTTKLNVIKSDLLTGSQRAYGVLLCNLPYVPDNFTINQAAMNEPKIAIFGGEDGLDLYRRLFDQLQVLDLKPTYILTESLPTQHTKLAQVAYDAGFRLQTDEDFIQVFVRI